ncbi:hypothetical protein DENSPDRAFT_746363, partial [Dentipellis sp. KUC8613]
RVSYKLKGVIYLGGNHFTARIVGNKGEVWYHDGIGTKHNSEYEGQLPNLKDMFTAKDRAACMMIY